MRKRRKSPPPMKATLLVSFEIKPAFVRRNFGWFDPGWYVGFDIKISNPKKICSLVSLLVA